MNFLAAIMPGVREMRAPFATGALWIAAAILGLYPHLAKIQIFRLYQNVTSIIALLPATVALATLAFATYIIGVVADAITRSLAARVFTTRNVYGEEGPSLAVRRLMVSRWLERGFNPSSDRRLESILKATLRIRLSRHSTLVPQTLDEDMLLRESSLAALRWSKEAPEQFQQYDRVQAEAGFRLSIATPLAALGITAALQLPGTLALMAIPALALGLYVAHQGNRLTRQARSLLASALYFGYTSTPLLDELDRELKEVMSHLPEDKDEVAFLTLINFTTKHQLRRETSHALAVVFSPPYDWRRERIAANSGMLSREAAEAFLVRRIDPRTFKALPPSDKAHGYRGPGSTR